MLLDLTPDEVTARHAACACGKLPFYLGEHVMCPVHTEPEFTNLLKLRREQRTGDTAPDEEPA